MTAPLWQPSPERIASSEMFRYMRWLEDSNIGHFKDYHSLWLWSVKNPEAFWQSLWQFFDVQGDAGTCTAENIDTMPGTRWFPESKLNFAENLLSRDDELIALIEYGEQGKRQEISYRELKRQVAVLANYLRGKGLRKGDRVAGFVPNSHHAVVAMLATASLGGVWSSCSPDFGFNGVIDRFSQIQPRFLIALNAYQYAGKTIDVRDRVRQISSQLTDLQEVITFRYLDEPDLAYSEFSQWESIIGDKQASADIHFEALDFSDPLYILYSSGTTGKPKCIVHSVGGTLLQHLKELALHSDVTAGTRLFYYTTCGWMMWNWLVSGLALGASVILYDGSPFHPKQSVLFDLAESESIEVFGASAKYYAACEKYGLLPGESHRLDNLKALLSTGSPLSHESFDYLYNKVKTDVCVSSISGGTDIVSCFALGCPILPVHRGELQCPGLGMDVDFVDETGNHLKAGKGELVCRTPFPSMPTGFWNDPEDQRFRKAYFSRFEGIWAHGDYGEFRHHHFNLPDGSDAQQLGVVIHGRSDAVLNPGGVRIGTAEIYRQVEKVPEVFEAIAVGQQWQDDVRIILFVRLKDGLTLDDALRDKIRQTIRHNTTPRHVPAKVLQVSDIPRTLSGKIVELAVRDTIHGEAVQNTEALANPEALELYKDIPELKEA